MCISFRSEKKTKCQPGTLTAAHLDGNVVDVQEAEVVRDSLDPEHDPSGQGDEVAVEGLGDEGERPRRPQVALDHLRPSVVVSNVKS